jgi:hypothetical protein
VARLDAIAVVKSPLPVEHFDVSKRYDIYCSLAGEYRLYENVKLIAVKTLDDIRERGVSLRGYLEIEMPDGKRTMIRMFPIHAICEHGTKPAYTVLKKSDQ